jgi:aryl-alcohol dehydrogenase-like predicted oxidoreductase
MQYRTLGQSDLKISAVTLGTWAIGGFMWGGTDEKKAVEAIHKSIDLGITAIDTAPAYGFGLSETIVGRAIAGKRDSLQILTKFGLSWDDPGKRAYWEMKNVDGSTIRIHHDARKERVIKECEDSLRRLGVDHIDLYQQHWPDPDTPIDETMEAVEKLLSDGKILVAGVSNFSVQQVEEARRTVPIASNQPPYSMLKRGIEKDMVPYCIKNQIGLVVYSPLQLGLLTGKVSPDREFPDTDLRAGHPLFTKENRERILAFLERIRPIAESHNATLAQVVINWTVHRPGITAALVGARNAQQAEKNAGALDFELTQEETAKINQELDNLELMS